ncbi:MAG: hypothetical protein IJB85_10195 [Clostridia bacterium]|nr:hypothetical protein [Clostridia bacterium]
MTAMIIFAALVAASIAYSIYDNRCDEVARQIDDYYRIEFKKSYQLSNGPY